MNSLITPKWNITLLKEKNVYDPAEDTFLLLDAIEKDLQLLTAIEPRIVLEIGSGSGIIISALATIFQSKTFCLAIDINSDACSVTSNTATLNNIKVDVIHSDLLDNVLLCENLDVIVFNPPYVATDEHETSICGITQSWAGGESGRRIVDRLFPVISKALSVGGIFYLVAISYNDVQNIFKIMEGFSLKGEIIMRRQVPGELLFILRFIKEKN